MTTAAARDPGRLAGAAAVLAIAVSLTTVGASAGAAPLEGTVVTANATEWTGSVSSPTDASVRLDPATPATDPPTATIRIDPADRGTVWSGVGAAMTDASVSLLAGHPEAQALLFDPDRADGARLDTIRLPLSATDFSTDWWTWSWHARHQRATPTAEALAAIQLTVDMAALAGDLTVVATPWTAPAKMKTTRRLDGGALRSRSVDDYADLLAAQAEYLLTAGVPLDALTVVNEPGHSGDYPTMTMTDEQLVAVGNRIAPRLDEHGVGLWAVDHNWADRERVDDVLDASPDTWEAAAFHCYGGSPGQMAGLPVPAVITECTGTTDTWEGTFAWDARNLVVDAVRAGSTGLMMWNLALDPEHGPKAPGGCDRCRGLLTIDPVTGTVTPTPEFFTLAHLTRAARPGSVAAATQSPADLPAVAFVRPDGSIGVFGHNDTDVDQVVGVRVDGIDRYRAEVPAGALFSLAGIVD